MHSGDVSATPITPKVLYSSVIWHYSKAKDAFVVSMNGEEIFHTKDLRDADLFMAELKASILLQGSRVETTPDVPNAPEPKPVGLKVWKESEFHPKVIGWFPTNKIIPPLKIRVLVKLNSGYKTIAKRLFIESDWVWVENGDIHVAPSEVEFWAPIPN